MPGETLTIAPPEAMPAPPQVPAAVEQAPSTPERDKQLEQLFGVDYHYVKDSGILDKFDYRPEEGVDGLVHTLAGDVDTGKGDINIPGGYHHEPSGQVWGNKKDAEGNDTGQPLTYVDRTHLVEAKASHARWFRERPAEPYLAHVAIGGRPKMAASGGADGARHLMHARSGMYPKEYDAMAATKAVLTAYDNRDVANQRPSVDHRGEPVIVATGEATLIDGASKMPIRLILNAETGRIKSAMPLVNGKNGIMNLTEDEMWAHATGQTPLKPR